MNTLRDIYDNGKYLSIKHDSYFQVYEELLTKYKGKPITFVEIGILNGGSLFMWREFFGEKASIIGIDFNPLAKKWEEHGFKIFIGSQSDPLFWDNFFKAVGNVDIILDDGGHTNLQQIVTVDKTLNHINDGGILAIEDVHTSYMKKFNNPSQHSFINFSKTIIDKINARFPKIRSKSNIYRDQVYSMSFYESIVAFHVDRKKCFISSQTSNNGISSNAIGYRNSGTTYQQLSTLKSKLKEIPVIKYFSGAIIYLPKKIAQLRERSKVKRYF